MRSQAGGGERGKNDGKEGCEEEKNTFLYLQNCLCSNAVAVLAGSCLQVIHFLRGSAVAVSVPLAH